jgi:hypothetical protein
MPQMLLGLDGRAQKFPREASLRIALSIVRSAIAFRKRVFSASISFNRFSLVDPQTTVLLPPSVMGDVRDLQLPAGGSAVPRMKKSIRNYSFAWYSMVGTFLK